MNARLHSLCACAVVLLLAAVCPGAEPDDSQAIAQLRREVAELRQAVAELQAQLATNQSTLWTPSSNLRVVPLSGLQSSPVKKIEPRSKGPLRIPIEVERAMMAPPWRGVPQNRR